ncbi:MAG: DUF5009 domain-containing protein [Flavobacteriales bacterium]|nr:DUF5009 domain-containing protein [Flavobacteriales bacterium]
MEKKERIKSIDVLRGLTVATMITVNNPGTWGAIYPPLKHAPWSGCTPTDLVFPFFMFIVGASMWFVFSKAGCSFDTLGKKTVWRAFKIYAVGFLLTWYPFFSFPIEMAPHEIMGIEFSFPAMKNLDTIRIMGVLQRIGVAYGITGLLILGLKKMKYILSAAAVILIGYWVVMMCFGTGETYMDVNGNAAQRFDLWLLGSRHLYTGYGTAFDPEGLLSTLPACVNIIFGYLAGSIISKYKEDKLMASQQLMFWGAVGIMIGLAWDLAFPINKPIWSSSYVFFTCGWASVLLGMCIYIIDVKKKDRLVNPLLTFGMNPLFIFMMAGLVAKTMALIKIPYQDTVLSLQPYLYKTVFVPLGGFITEDPRFASLLWALFYIIIFWLIAHILYKKNIFIKL